MNYRKNFELWLNDKRLCQEGVAELKAVEDDVKAIEYRFGGELSQMETAKRMGVSQMNVSRMERRVLQKLRETMKKSMVEG